MTVLAAIMVLALLTITVGGVVIGSVVLARHRAQGAADLAALAAAARVPAGTRAACLRAQEVAAAMRATLRRCDIVQLDVTVEVAVRPGLRMSAEARATARAGPSLGG